MRRDLSRGSSQLKYKVFVYDSEMIFARVVLPA